MGEKGPAWEAWEADGSPGSPRCAPGSYMKVRRPSPTLPDENYFYWYIKDPDGEIGTINMRHHQVVEHENGTITVTPSILAKDGWHGFLRAGVWSDA